MRRTTLSLVLAARLSNALVNITVDDADAASISFTSQNCLTLQPDEAGRSWEVSPGKFVHSCHNQTLRRCDEAGASVNFKFTGVAVYLLYPPWPHEMTLIATLDSNPPVFLTLPARSDEAFVHLDNSSTPVWGLSGLPNTEHSLTISREGGGVYVDAFMYTALCDTTLCRRRRGGTEPESTADTEADSISASSSSSSVSGSSTSSSASSSTSFSTSFSTSSVSSSSSSSVPLPATAVFQNTSSHKDTVGIILGAVLGVLSLAIALLSFFFYHRFRRRTRTPKAHGGKGKPSLPYTLSGVSSSEPTRPPSMRERNDRFTDTHTPAGTPLTRSPGASFLTSLSSNMAHLSTFPGPGLEKGGHLASLDGTSTHDDASEAPLEIPPPEYETHQ